MSGEPERFTGKGLRVAVTVHVRNDQALVVVGVVKAETWEDTVLLADASLPTMAMVWEVAHMLDRDEFEAARWEWPQAVRIAV